MDEITKKTNTRPTSPARNPNVYRAQLLPRNPILRLLVINHAARRYRESSPRASNPHTNSSADHPLPGSSDPVLFASIRAANATIPRTRIIRIPTPPPHPPNPTIPPLSTIAAPSRNKVLTALHHTVASRTRFAPLPFDVDVHTQAEAPPISSSRHRALGPLAIRHARPAPCRQLVVLHLPRVRIEARTVLREPSAPGQRARCAAPAQRQTNQPPTNKNPKNHRNPTPHTNQQPPHPKPDPTTPPPTPDNQRKRAHN